MTATAPISATFKAFPHQFLTADDSARNIGPFTSKLQVRNNIIRARGGVERYRHGMAIRVECYAGYRGEQEPLAFWLGERRIAVLEVIDRWFAPTQRWFKVEADDGDVYVLRQDEANGEWEIAAYRRAGD